MAKDTWHTRNRDQWNLYQAAYHRRRMKDDSDYKARQDASHAKYNARIKKERADKKEAQRAYKRDWARNKYQTNANYRKALLEKRRVKNDLIKNQMQQIRDLLDVIAIDARGRGEEARLRVRKNLRLIKQACDEMRAATFKRTDEDVVPFIVPYKPSVKDKPRVEAIIKAEVKPENWNPTHYHDRFGRCEIMDDGGPSPLCRFIVKGKILLQRCHGRLIKKIE